MTKFESLAHSWLRLAKELERAEALLEQLKAPARKANWHVSPLGFCFWSPARDFIVLMRLAFFLVERLFPLRSFSCSPVRGGLSYRLQNREAGFRRFTRN
jgi:hypothetical protein